MRIEAELRY